MTSTGPACPVVSIDRHPYSGICTLAVSALCVVVFVEILLQAVYYSSTPAGAVVLLCIAIKHLVGLLFEPVLVTASGRHPACMLLHTMQ